MTQALVSGFPEAARELRRGEIVRWAGSPEGPPPLAPIAFIAIFALFWTGLSLVWEAAALGFFWDAWFGENRSHTPRWIAVVMALFGAPFVVVGLGMLVAPWFMIRQRRGTIYIVTDQRLLTIRRGRKRETESIEARQIFQVIRTDHGNGFGDVEVARSTKTDSEGDLVEARAKLEGLRDARGAEAALVALARR